MGPRDDYCSSCANSWIVTGEEQRFTSLCKGSKIRQTTRDIGEFATGTLELARMEPDVCLTGGVDPLPTTAPM